MTAIKNGIKCTLRTPWKTALFSLVLVMLAALLTLSLCVYTAVRSYLADCDDYYHTIANLEYIGNDYPESAVYDPDLEKALEENRAELEALLRSREVLSFEPESNTAAVVEDFHRWDNYVLEPSQAILRLRNQMYDDRLDMYIMEVVESCYTGKDYTGSMIFVRTDAMPANGGEQLESGLTYYAVGRFFKGQTSNPWFFAEETSFYEGEGLVKLPPFTPDDGTESVGEAYRRFAGIAKLRNDSCRVYYSAALEDYPPFQQQMITLKEGRLFREEEYAARARVCVLSDRISGALGLGVGDKIRFTVYSAAEALYEPGKWETADEGAFEIVGIYKNSDDYPYRIFLPDAAAAEAGVRTVTGYRLGHFRLQNDSAAEFEALTRPLQEKGFRVTVYDQGYAAATEPMRELMLISVIFLAVCLLLALVAHGVQSHLFVSRQREAALTMRALGSGKGHVILYFLSAALLLALVSTLLGGLAGKLLEQRVMDALRQFATQFADRDLRFSGSRLSLSRTLAFAPSIPLGVYLLSGALLILGSLLFTAAFADRTLRERKGGKKTRSPGLRTVPRRAGRSTSLSGALKYALLSMRRGLIRTTAVILLCLTAAAFFGRLTTSLDGYKAQLASYRENAVVTGFATDYKGQLIDGLVLRTQPINNVLAAELLSDYTLTDTVAHCELIGVSVRADGTEQELPPVRVPELGSFAFDTMMDRLRSKCRWIGASSVNGSPIFHYAKVKDIRWLEGFSDADFNGGSKLCALPEPLMEEYGIELGDTVRFLFVDSSFFAVWVAGTVDVRVVAAYSAAASKPCVFSPINYIPSVEVMARTYGVSAAEFGSENIATRTYDSFLFSLGSSDELDEFRQTLADSGFTWVRSGDRSKPYAIVEDEIFLSTTHSMERQIQYVGVLYDALYIIAGVIGFVLAWLLTLSRRKEIAVMRALGTQPVRLLLNFSFEQAVLSTLGILLGVGLSLLLGCGLSRFFRILCGGFWLIWNLAVLLCLLAGLRKPSYASLNEPD